MDKSISQAVDYALRVAMANAKAPPNADFRDKGALFSDPFERTIWSNTIKDSTTKGCRVRFSVSYSDY